MALADFDSVDHMIRSRMRRERAQGILTAKNPDGKTVEAILFARGSSPVTCNTERGVWGALRVGDRITARTNFSTPIVTGTFEGSGWNGFQRIGEDIDGGTTTSVDDWVTLCDINDVHVSRDAFALFTFGADIVVNAPQGTGQKQVRIVFNSSVVLTVDLGAGAGGFFAAFIIGPMPPWGSLRSVEGLNATWSSVATSTAVETITRLRIQGRTQDEQNGLDELTVGSVIIYG